MNLYNSDRALGKGARIQLLQLVAVEAQVPPKLGMQSHGLGFRGLGFRGTMILKA